MRGRALAVLAAVFLTLSCASTKGGLDPLIASTTARGEWTTWGGDAGFQRYSPLDQINAANVGTLEIAWRWKMLPLVILLSSFAGAIVGIALIIVARRGRNVPIPFGPYLAIAGLVALFHGEVLTRRYLDLF